MKLYNRNIMRKRLGDFDRQRIPDRDAVVWSVNTSNFYALVKVQGSGTTIKAHYPRNWQVTPTWMKPGNAVRIRHRAGVQGYIEIIGHGRAIPTPVEGDALPTPGTQEDGIVSGMEILPYADGGMNVYVADGVYRIDGTLYSFTAPVTGYIVMDDPAPMIMGGSVKLGWGDTVTPVVISAAPTGDRGRYDALVVGTDGVVDVIEGSPTSLGTEPSKPSTPADHALIGYLFIYTGMTEITAGDIGVMWTAPAANTVTITSSIKTANGTFEFPWSAVLDEPTASLSVSITDQYGNGKSLSTTMTVTLLIGTGGVYFSGGTPGSSASAQIGSSKSFIYKRNQIASPEISPLIQIDFAGYAPLTTLIPIICLDVSGEPV